MRRKRRGLIGLAAALLVVSLTTSCGASPPAAEPIVIGSFDFPESELLGELYRRALEGAGLPAVHRARIGDRGEVLEQMRAGELDLVPEYLGSGLEVTFGLTPTNDLAGTLAAYTEAWLAEGFMVMQPAAAQSQNGFAITRRLADELGIATLTQLAPLAPGLTFGGPPECPDRPRCLLGLRERYGIEFGAVITLDAGGPATLQALENGTIDVGLVFTSDPAIEDGALTLLIDDGGLQPVESIVPVVSNGSVERYGSGYLDVVNAVSALLDQSTFIEMNRLVAGGSSPGDAAEQWLRLNDFAP